MAITNSTLFSGPYTEIKNFLNSNITDPKGRYKKQWVHAAEPNLAGSFDGFPFIVINVDVDEEQKGFDRSTSNKVFRAEILIYSDEATQVDSVSDEVLQKFKDETLTNSLSEFKSIEIASSPFIFRIIGGKKIYLRTLGIIGRTRL